ncbi:TRF-like 7 [Prunus dulcis]|uniref:TRF-like 7 n=1 Tax=Prunus dulcis TaxID=3755 RepID=A0A4Y1RJP1_PRUDU|nr:TRF-like 7 [Prunus dulcis]
MDSDVDVSRWVLELLIRDREKECIAKRVLAVAPFSDQDYRLKKTVLLRTIECDVYDALVSETMLETLEMIEDLDLTQGIATTDSMKAAYFAVATECTVKFLVGLMGKPSGKYLEAVDRIWRGRVGALERSETSQLISAELRQRMDEVEAGVWDLRVSKKLSRMNTRNDALRLVAVYVKEALALMGPPFITWAVRLNVPKEVADLEGDQIAVAKEANVGGGPEAEAQTKNGANVGDRSELEAQTENGANAGDGSELEAQMANAADVGGESELEAQMENGANVGEWGNVQMASGTNAVDGSELEKEVVNETNAGDGSQLELQNTNGTNAAGESVLEVQMVSGANVGDGSELEAHTVNATNVGSESELEAQLVNGTNLGDGCELQAQRVNEANGSCGFESGPQPMTGVQLREVGARRMPPTMSRDLVLNEMDSGFTNREVLRFGDDQVHATGVGLPSTNRELVLSLDPTTKDKEIQRSTGLRYKHLAHRRTRGPVRIRDAEDMGTDLSNSKYDSLSTPEVSNAQEALRSSILELQAVVTDPLPDALRVAETIRLDLAMKSVNAGAENLSVEKGAGPVQSHNDNLGNMSVPQSSGKEKDVPTPPVNQGKGTESVQTDDANLGNPSSSNKNNAPRPMTDPLPDALRVAETIRLDLAKKSVNVGAENLSVEIGAGPVQSHNDNLGNVSVSQSSRKEKDVPNPPVNQGKGTESVQTDDVNLGNPSSSNKNNAPRPSLMERNTTAHTYEWDDSIDTSQGAMKDPGRLYLPSPKRNAVSPLKKYENKRFTKRRKAKRWSLLEEDTLRTGVQKYGAGNWKFILNSYREIFEERTEVDLKDKWRNMTR